MEVRVYLQGTLRRLTTALKARLGYLVIRNTIYKGVYDRFKPVKPTNDLSHREKGVIAAIAGGLATLAIHPLEVRMVRQIGDLGRASTYQRSNLNERPYSGLRINVLRSMILNGIIIWPYDVMKEKLFISFGDIWPNRFIALICATFVGMGTTIILDNIKTRQMFAHSNPSLNRLNYKNALDALSKSIAHEGIYTHFAGAYPMFLKMYVYSASVS
jgi:hypothetical protein